MSNTAASDRDEPTRANTALAMAVVAVALFALAMIIAGERNSWLWPVAGVLGGLAAVTGWAVGRPRPHGRALTAVVLGGVVFVTVGGWVVWALATGNM